MTKKISELDTVFLTHPLARDNARRYAARVTSREFMLFFWRVRCPEEYRTAMKGTRDKQARQDDKGGM